MKCDALYVHIPFCHHICNYCDFLKMKYYLDFADKYLISLEKELSMIEDRQMRTIYIGGGTPSSLDIHQLDALLTMLDPFASKVEEYTIEINPENIDEQKISCLSRHGVNRLSIGVQTFNDKFLSELGRKHCQQDVINLIELAKKYGLNNISIDLIYGLPNQRLLDFRKDIKFALALSIKHLSLYALSIEKHTIFDLNKFGSASDDHLAAMYHTARKLLTKAGFIHYEISNFAQPEHCSKHNLTYWRAEQYYGVGAGATGNLNNIRYENTKNITKYLSGQNNRVTITNTRYDREFEYIMLNLRTSEGINFHDYKQIFDYEFIERYKSSLQKLQGYLVQDMQCVYISSEYFLIANQIILLFIEELDQIEEGKKYAKS